MCKVGKVGKVIWFFLYFGLGVFRTQEIFRFGLHDLRGGGGKESISAACSLAVGVSPTIFESANAIALAEEKRKLHALSFRFVRFRAAYGYLGFRFTKIEIRNLTQRISVMATKLITLAELGRRANLPATALARRVQAGRLVPDAVVESTGTLLFNESRIPELMASLSELRPRQKTFLTLAS